jgi:hypothetical protein
MYNLAADRVRAFGRRTSLGGCSDGCMPTERLATGLRCAWQCSRRSLPRGAVESGTRAQRVELSDGSRKAALRKAGARGQLPVDVMGEGLLARDRCDASPIPP